MCALGISGAAPQLTSAKRGATRESQHGILGRKKHLSNAQHGLQADKKGLFWSIAWFILQCFSTQGCLHKVTRKREVTEHRVPPLWRGTWFISSLEVPVSSWHAQWCQNKIHHPTAICSFAFLHHSLISAESQDTATSCSPKGDECFADPPCLWFPRSQRNKCGSSPFKITHWLYWPDLPAWPSKNYFNSQHEMLRRIMDYLEGEPVPSHKGSTVQFPFLQNISGEPEIWNPESHL